MKKPQSNSMIEPPIGVLLDKMDSRYTLVSITAKRARQLNSGAHKLTDKESDKSVTLAVNEVAEGRIAYVRTKSGIK